MYCNLFWLFLALMLLCFTSFQLADESYSPWKCRYACIISVGSAIGWLTILVVALYRAFTP